MCDVRGIGADTASLPIWLPIWLFILLSIWVSARAATHASMTWRHTRSAPCLRPASAYSESSAKMGERMKRRRLSSTVWGGKDVGKM
eukprot:6200411-Pleurochrysis_carterae.AAC.6